MAPYVASQLLAEDYAMLHKLARKLPGTNNIDTDFPGCARLTA